jgi:hypothetical protein
MIYFRNFPVTFHFALLFCFVRFRLAVDFPVFSFEAKQAKNFFCFEAKNCSLLFRIVSPQLKTNGAP